MRRNKRFPSADSPMRYLLPVLWIKSYFYITGQWVNGPESKTTRMFHRVRHVAAPKAKLLSTIAANLWVCLFTVITLTE